MKYTMTSSYLSSVHAPAVLDGYELAELTNGSRSGWMFTVNGKHGSLSVSQQELKDGDVIIVHYINDYLYEEDKFPWLDAKDAVSSNPVEPQPTDPKPTNPQPTDPQPTNPQPTNPSVSTDPTDPFNPSNPTEPTNPSDSNNPNTPKDDTEKCTCWCCRFWWLILLAGTALGALLMWVIPVVVRKIKEND